MLIYGIKSRGLSLSSVATQLIHIAIILASTETGDGDRDTVYVSQLFLT